MTNLYCDYSQEDHDSSMSIIDNHILKNQTHLVNELLKHELPHLDICLDNILNLIDEDNDIKEVMEWWLVDHWLAEILNLHDEVDILGSTEAYWGRTTCGQSIIMDGIIQKIVQNQLQIDHNEDLNLNL